MTADLALLMMKEGMLLAAGEKIDFEVQLRVVGDLFLAKDPLFYINTRSMVYKSMVYILQGSKFAQY